MVERAWMLLQQESPAEALRLALRVLAAEPANISAIACRAMAQWDVSGENAQSLADMKRAVEMAPAVPALRHNYGTLLTRAGRVEEAAEQYRTALALRPDDTQAFWGLTQSSRFGANEATLFSRMEELHADPTINGLRRQFLAYGLAKAADDMGDPRKAIDYASEGNRLLGRSGNGEQIDGLLAELRQLADTDAFRRMKTSGHPSRAPLFIVGMPRSGTTLIETILSRHADVLALGESKQIPTAQADAQRFRPLGRIDPGEGIGRDWLKSQAETMVRGWSRRRPGYALVTDKMPDNAFALGLVAQLFPNARVVYARRHPLDTGISNFLVRYAEGQGFSTRLDWIGQRSRQLADVMDMWKRSIDLHILDVFYERLVADPETQIRRLAEFVGLDWTEAFLTPEQSDRAVRTASQWQVRQPIYKTSVARWTRYEPWIGPMIEAMGGMDWIEAQMVGAAD